MTKIKKFFLKSVRSTNFEIKKIKDERQLDNSIALITEIQTKGKGRGTNSWLSSKGDLMCSLLINHKFNIKDFSKLNIIISVYIIRVLKKKFNNLAFKIKWPNDIYLDQKKIGGILIENSVKKNDIEYIIIGFGLNIASSPKNLNYHTTKISNYQKSIDPKEIFNDLVDYFEKNSLLESLLNFHKLKKDWLGFYHDIGKEKNFKFNKISISGKLNSITDDGNIEIITNDRTIILTS